MTTTLEIDPLTNREEAVLRLMTAGQTNSEIAGELVVSLETVRWYTKQIYGKLGVHGRTQAVLRSRELGLFKTEPKLQSQPVPNIQLPQYPTPFVGRSQELQEIGQRLNEPQVRLITIAGPGGMGKTRFCAELARQNSSNFPDGVYFISLASLDSMEEVTAEIVHRIRLHLPASKEPGHQLAAYLRDKKVLLVLDNMEHLADGPAWVSSLLTATRQPKLLVSSQTSLNVSAEWVRYLEGIPYPAQAADNAEEYAAVQLFLERARRVHSDFDMALNLPCVVEICRYMHGHPLALELAAAWLKSLPCPEIKAEIKAAPDFLITRHQDLEDRHHSLNAVFNYSWKLLSKREQRVLLRLSPFRGGFSRITAEQVAGADLHLLSSLVDKSFLTHSGEGMYLFHELLRHYAAVILEKLQADSLTTQSGKLLLWSLFTKGDFARAEQLAADILSRSLPGTFEQAFGLALTGLLAGMEENYEHCWKLSKVALSAIEKKGNNQDTMTELFVHLGLAVAACGFGDYEQIRQQTVLALTQAQKMKSPAFVLLCLPVSAVFIAHNAESEQAVQLLSLTFNHQAHTSAWLEKWPLLTQLQNDLTAELGADRFAEQWEKGKTADLETMGTAVLAILQETT